MPTGAEKGCNQTSYEMFDWGNAPRVIILISFESWKRGEKKEIHITHYISMKLLTLQLPCSSKLKNISEFSFFKENILKLRHRKHEATCYCDRLIHNFWPNTSEISTGFSQQKLSNICTFTQVVLRLNYHTRGKIGSSTNPSTVCAGVHNLTTLEKKHRVGFPRGRRASPLIKYKFSQPRRDNGMAW